MIQKYRAWDKRQKKMGDIKAWSEFNGGEVTLKREGQNASYVVPIADVIPMQSTELFDSSETPKEIFDGDIVKLHHFVTKYNAYGGAYESEKEIVGVIRYGYPSEEIKTIGKVYTPRWYIETKENAIAIDFIGGLHEESFTVLGNIHQHPFLLEELE